MLVHTPFCVVGCFHASFFYNATPSNTDLLACGKVQLTCQQINRAGVCELLCYDLFDLILEKQRSAWPKR